MAGGGALLDKAWLLAGGEAMFDRALVEREEALLDEETELWKNELYLVPQLYHVRLYCIRTGTPFSLIHG